MQFLYPAFLWSLLAIGIPILIHLFNFRRFKRILFTNVRFLKEVKQESQKQRNLKHLLVLASRILAITCFVLAFSQPYIPAGNKQSETGQKGVSIYIDNSFSMNAESEKGNLLEQAKNKAREIASAYSESDKFQLLTNSFGGIYDRFYTREEFNRKLDEVEIDPSSKSLKDIIRKQSNFLTGSGLRFLKAYIISDYQKSFCGKDVIEPTTGVEYHLVPLASGSSPNLSIDSAWFESPVFQPNTTLKLAVRIKNSGEINLEGGTLALKLNGIQKSISGFDIAAGETKTVAMGFSAGNPGWYRAELKLTDHPIVFDDAYHFTFQVYEHANVLALYSGSPNRFIQKAFATEPFFQLSTTETDRVDYAGIAEQDLIILNGLNGMSSGLSQELGNYLDNGGNLVIFPENTPEDQAGNAFLSGLGCNTYSTFKTAAEEVGAIDFRNELLGNIIENQGQALTLPVVKRYYLLGNDNSTPAFTLIKTRSGTPFLKAYDKGRGHIYQFAVGLNNDWSNLQQNQLFVPLMFRMALMKKNEIPLAYTIGTNELLKPVRMAAQSSKPLQLVNGDLVVMVEKIIRNNELFLTENNQIKQPGIYQLADPDENKPVQDMAFNYDRAESEMAFVNVSDLGNLVRGEAVKIYEKTDLPLNSLIRQEENGKPLWRLFIWLTLLFIAIEILLLRFWKNAPKPSPAVS